MRPAGSFSDFRMVTLISDPNIQVRKAAKS